MADAGAAQNLQFKCIIKSKHEYEKEKQKKKKRCGEGETFISGKGDNLHDENEGKQNMLFER